MSTNTWSRSGGDYFPASIATLQNELEPGIYQYASSMSGWYLVKGADRFEFPFKIYGGNPMILNRIEKAWDSESLGNLGVLLNGLKGSGKTVMAQQICNWAIDRGIAVLKVNQVIGELSDILFRLQQPVLVLFDEFEKTHFEKKHQEHLLTILDGTAKNSYPRLFLFTTNDPNVDTNMIDRPSRIRYTFNFEDMNSEMIAQIVDDLLDPQYKDLREKVIFYIEQRRLRTIDSVKATINEVNIFGETPEVFETFFNLSKKTPSGVSISIVNEDGTKTEVFTRTYVHALEQSVKVLAESAKEEYYRTRTISKNYWMLRSAYNDHNSARITLIAPAEEPGCWMAEMSVPANTTWVSKNDNHHPCSYAHLIMDEKPEDWKLPFTKSSTEDEIDDWWENKNCETIYGGKPKIFKVFIEVDYSEYKTNWKAF